MHTMSLALLIYASQFTRIRMQSYALDYNLIQANDPEFQIPESKYRDMH